MNFLFFYSLFTRDVRSRRVTESCALVIGKNVLNFALLSAGGDDHLCLWAGWLMLSVIALCCQVTFLVKQFPFSGVHHLCLSDVVVHLNNILPQVDVLPKGSVWALCTCYDSVAIIEEKTWACRSHS